MSHPITVLPTPRKPPAPASADEPGTIIITYADWTPTQHAPVAPRLDYCKLACWVVVGAFCLATLLGVICLFVAAASALGGLLVHIAVWGM